jgi:NAD(P)-dependent dehydrogenase (short-subunit alcohol dehydrogenase family)
MRRLEGRLVVVTGAAIGIGRAIATRFATEGARLALVDRDLHNLEQTAELARALGAEVQSLKANCIDETEVKATFERIAADMGAVDVLVNNVGQSARERAAEFHESSSDVWRFVIDVSLMSTLLASRQVVGAMREARSGRIVNLSSTAGLSGEVRVAEYAAAKMGVIGFTRSLAQELAPFGVNVNAVCPGVTRTAALDGLGPEFTAMISAKIPMRSINEPEDIAAAVAFLASDDARRMTGQSLVVDGGNWMV